MTGSIGVLVAPGQGATSRPSELPMGRAALRLAAEGLDVVFGGLARGGRLVGHRAVADRWEPAEATVRAAYDRYPSQTDPAGFAALLAELGEVVVANPDDAVRLCRDKLATQRVLEAAGVPIPEVEADPSRFAAALASWGAGFLKPRHGAFGRGVSRVTPGDPLPAVGEGAVPGVADVLFLQRAVPPPEGWAGVACRVLVQRERGGWWLGPPVARRSRVDAVVNAARGSEVVPLAEMAPDLVDAVAGLAGRVATALAAAAGGPRLVELGVDVVLARDGGAWVVEANSKPRGRLLSLAETDPGWLDAHVEACCRPLRALAALP